MLENVLAKISLFSALPEASITQLANHTYTHIYEKDTIITREGDVSDVLYVILSGSVKVFLANRQGKCVTLRVLHRGDYFGELSLLDESSRSASVITLNKTMLAIIDKAEFMSCLRNTPEIAIKLCIELSRRMRAMTENVKDLQLNEDKFKKITKIPQKYERLDVPSQCQQNVRSTVQNINQGYYKSTVLPIKNGGQNPI